MEIGLTRLLLISREDDPAVEDTMRLHVRKHYGRGTTMARRIKTLQVVLSVMLTLTAFSAEGQERKTVDFDNDTAGKAPHTFKTALTGRGKTGQWVVKEVSDAPSGRNVLAQVSADSTSYRFPVCVLDTFTGKDVDVSVRFKPVSGKVDQAAGLVWRYKNKDNYYIVRANALEENVVLYKVQDGKRTDLPLVGAGRTYGKKTPVPSGKWSTLRVVAKGNQFTVYVNEKELFAVEDATFPNTGKVGLWTKADSVTYFDDLAISPL
jgi:hypothetical protein